jgi:hypothetical protein
MILLTLGLGLMVVSLYWAMAIRGSEKRHQRALEKLQSAVMANEMIEHSAIQLRSVALSSRRKLVAVSASRIVVITRPLLGGFSMGDYQWKDLRDARLSENVFPSLFGSKLVFAVNAGSLTINGLPSSLASQIYKYAQQEEQAWEEKRRVRELEEKRAASGGFVMHGGPNGQAGSPAGGLLEEIERAKRMLDSGVISDAEYHEIKAKILSRGSS